jgi:hypothetical protein
MALLDVIINADGSTFEIHGPPYTEEEEDAFYHRYAKGMMSGQATVVHREAAPTEPPAPRPPPAPLSPTRSLLEEEPPYRRNLGLK